MPRFAELDAIGEKISCELKLKDALVAAIHELGIGKSTINAQGLYEHVNEHYARTCGYEPDEMAGMDWTKTVYPDDIPLAMECYQRMLDKPNEPSSLTFRGVRKNGEIFTKSIMLVASGRGGHFCLMKETR